jgi:hypothetical protein
VPLCPPKTPHAARTRTRAAAVGCQRLTDFNNYSYAKIKFSEFLLFAYGLKIFCHKVS